MWQSHSGDERQPSTWNPSRRAHRICSLTYSFGAFKRSRPWSVVAPRCSGIQSLDTKVSWLPLRSLCWPIFLSLNSKKKLWGPSKPRGGEIGFLWRNELLRLPKYPLYRHARLYWISFYVKAREKVAEAVEYEIDRSSSSQWFCNQFHPNRHRNQIPCRTWIWGRNEYFTTATNL